MVDSKLIRNFYLQQFAEPLVLIQKFINDVRFYLLACVSFNKKDFVVAHLLLIKHISITSHFSAIE